MGPLQAPVESFPLYLLLREPASIDSILSLEDSRHVGRLRAGLERRGARGSLEGVTYGECPGKPYCRPSTETRWNVSSRPNRGIWKRTPELQRRKCESITVSRTQVRARQGRPEHGPAAQRRRRAAVPTSRRVLSLERDTHEARISRAEHTSRESRDAFVRRRDARASARRSLSRRAKGKSCVVVFQTSAFEDAIPRSPNSRETRHRTRLLDRETRKNVSLVCVTRFVFSTQGPRRPARRPATRRCRWRRSLAAAARLAQTRTLLCLFLFLECLGSAPLSLYASRSGPGAGRGRGRARAAGPAPDRRVHASPPRVFFLFSCADAALSRKVSREDVIFFFSSSRTGK